MFSFCLVNHPNSFSLDSNQLFRIFEDVEKQIPYPQNGIINIAFLSDEEMQRLNMQYRNIDATTDVLSFHYFEDFLSCDTDEVVGEIILSENKIITQASEHEHSSDIEARILILHGILHILGYDHETDEEYSEMWGHESILRNSIV